VEVLYLSCYAVLNNRSRRESGGGEASRVGVKYAGPQVEYVCGGLVASGRKSDLEASNSATYGRTGQ
jgi:hypothetical protein